MQRLPSTRSIRRNQQPSVIPSSVLTAAVGLYQNEFLDLPMPLEDHEPTNTTILAWIGSSSFGSSAIQLAMSGFRVISTASRHNFDFVKALGAERLLDCTKPSITEDLTHALMGKNLVEVYDSIGQRQTTQVCAEVLCYFGDGSIASVNTPPESLPDDLTAKKGRCPPAKPPSY